MLASGGAVKKELRAGIHPFFLRIEKDRPHALAKGGSAGFLGEHAVLSGSANQAIELLDLRGLAGSFDSLSGDEESIPHRERHSICEPPSRNPSRRPRR